MYIYIYVYLHIYICLKNSKALKPLGLNELGNVCNWMGIFVHDGYEAVNCLFVSDPTLGQLAPESFKGVR